MFGFSGSELGFHFSSTARRVLIVALACCAAPLAAQEPRAPAPPGDVIGVGNFAHIVANVDESLKFYHDVLGLEVTVTQGFAPNPAIEKFGHTEGGQSRIAVVKVPGIALGIELIEYKDIARKAQRAAILRSGRRELRDARSAISTALFPKVAAFPGVKVITAGGKPVTLKTPNGTLHAVFVQDPDGFVVEMLDAPNAPAGDGHVLSGSAFEATVANSEESVKFYKELLGFDMKLGTAFNDNQEMSSTAGAPGASFKQSTATIPGTSVPFTLIEFKNIERKKLSGRTQDPGTTVLQLVVKDVDSAHREAQSGGRARGHDGRRAGADRRRVSISRSCAIRTTCCSSSCERAPR